MRYASVLDLPPSMREQAERQLGRDAGVATFHVEAPAAKPSKYRNVKVELEGEKYDSRLEYDCHVWLKRRLALKEIGPVILRQVNFKLEGGVVYRADYVVNVAAFPFIEIWDAKGCDTRSSINKRKQVADRYGVEVRLWTKENRRAAL